MVHQHDAIAAFDPALWSAMVHESCYQEEHLTLIASENYASPRVLQAQGSVLSNHYTEHHPNPRYCSGNELADVIEQLAIARAKKLFGAGYANVQPDSSAQANTAAYAALLNPGDTILGPSLAHGGHLADGAPASFSSQRYNAVHYGLHRQTGEIDYDQMHVLARKHRPRLIVAVFSEQSSKLDFARLRAIADEVAAYLLVDIDHVVGLVAAGLYPNPVSIADIVTAGTHKTLRGPRGGVILARTNPKIEKKLDALAFPEAHSGPSTHVMAAKAVAFKEALDRSFIAYQCQVITNARAMVETFLARGYKVVSGGTHNHMFVVDLSGKRISGKDAHLALGKAHIAVNNNAQSPFAARGIRIGTPAVTTRRCKEPEVKLIAALVCDVLDRPGDESVIHHVREQIRQLCGHFPVYAEDCMPAARISRAA